ncbi:ferredoxin--NADP reductase [Mycolicibacterium smegmatis]|uniref:ferredoxin--NADP reductase n=1 Tax=Mycolicibacterium smegmatis TaxID=1772 RepID=UPI0018EF0471|nr:ferredoxin--NADP reductase [Mycolicibacterium smegmatis]
METSTTPLDETDGLTDADGFTPLRVKDVIRETADAVSLVLDVPELIEDRFRYAAGQFVTIKVTIGGEEHRRCYSMSSSPHVDADLRITVKRDRDGVVSNWINDTATAGDRLLTAPPDGRFVLTAADRDVVTFAGGSGVTPVFSLVNTTLATTGRRARMFYANRDADSVIFRDALTRLADSHRDRLRVHHHLDADHGVVSARHITEFLSAVPGSAAEAEFYVCGPGPFMDTVERVLLDVGVPAPQVHLERFTVTHVDQAVEAESAATEEVTIVLGRTTITQPYRAGTTLLQTARLAGLKAPSSCEVGTCGTCIGQVVEGSARLLNNDALDDDEIAEGWVVTCQALPTSRTVKVVYE